MNKTELLKNMNSTPHDPSEYIRGIQQVLISDKGRLQVSRSSHANSDCWF